jgi:hypothetical protein
MNWTKAQVQAMRAEGLTLEAIGRVLGVSRQRVHQILKESPTKMLRGSPPVTPTEFHGAYCREHFLEVKKSFKGIAKVIDTTTEDPSFINCWKPGCKLPPLFDLYYKYWKK